MLPGLLPPPGGAGKQVLLRSGSDSGGRSEKLNEGLAKKYANSLADLSESDDNGGMSDAEAML